MTTVNPKPGTRPMSWYSGGFLCSLVSPPLLHPTSLSCRVSEPGQKKITANCLFPVHLPRKLRCKDWSSSSKNRVGRKARLFIPCLVPLQFCPTSAAREMVGFFFQSLYLAPIISQMNKISMLPATLDFFFPFFMEKRGETSQT